MLKYLYRTMLNKEIEDNYHIDQAYAEILMGLSHLNEDLEYTMSHELRTPLNSIISFSSILNKKLIISC